MIRLIPFLIKKTGFLHLKLEEPIIQIIQERVLASKFEYSATCLLHFDCYVVCMYFLGLTHCILVDSSTVICWTSPFVILGVSDLFCCFYSIFD